MNQKDKAGIARSMKLGLVLEYGGKFFKAVPSNGKYYESICESCPSEGKCPPAICEICSHLEDNPPYSWVIEEVKK